MSIVGWHPAIVKQGSLPRTLPGWAFPAAVGLPRSWVGWVSPVSIVRLT